MVEQERGNAATPGRYRRFRATGHDDREMAVHAGETSNSVSGGGGGMS
jgi:hypothetical protein